MITVVAGAGGFIGGHLVRDLLAAGQNVRAIDRKPHTEWYQLDERSEIMIADLQDPTACTVALKGAGDVFNLAADMGGMGFIENNKALCMLSVLINTNLLRAAQSNNISRFFFASSACV